MSLARATASLSGAPSGTGEAGSSEACREEGPESGSSEACREEGQEGGGGGSSCEEEPCAPPLENGDTGDTICAATQGMAALSVQETEGAERPHDDRSPPDSEVSAAEHSSQCSSVEQKVASREPAPSTPDKELDALLSLCPAEPEPLDVLLIQSEHMGTVDIVKVERSQCDSEEGKGRAPPPPLTPPTTWTSANLREFKSRMAGEKHGQLTVRRGEVVTVRVPTHPDGKRLCWEFATDDYDIGFGVYFDWTSVSSTAVTLHVSESSDEEDEEAENP
ncbi:hypothetical protein FKM82_029447, partial [Ascaphus truei]